MKEELRELLKVPKEQRIAQFIAQKCGSYAVAIPNEKLGIVIHDMEDDEFIKLMENETNL